MDQNTTPQKQLIGNAPTEKAEDPAVLKAKLQAYAKFRAQAEDQMKRLALLMGRKSSQKWDVDKKQKMVRRFMNFQRDISDASDAIDALAFRLSQVSHE